MISNRNPGDKLAIRAVEWNEIARVVNASNLPNGGLVTGGELMVRCVNKGTTAIVANSLETAVVIDTLEYVSPGRDIIVVGIKNKAEVTDGATRPRINVQVSDGIEPGATGEGHVHGRISVLGANTGSKWYLDEDMAFADDGSFVIGGSVTIGTVNYYLIERLGGGAVDPNKYVYYSDLYSAYASIVGKIVRIGEDQPLLNTALSSIGKNVTIGYCVSEVATVGGHRVSKILLEGIIDDPTYPRSSKYYISTTGTITGTIPTDGCPMVIGNGIYDSVNGYQLYFKPEYPNISIVKLAIYEVGMTIPTLADGTIFGIY